MQGRRRIILSAVIFDFDGILVDTEPLHYKSFQMVLEPMGFTFGWEDYVREYMGFDDRDAFRTVYRKRGTELSPQAMAQHLADKAQAFLDVAARDGVSPYPGVKAILEALCRHGVPLGLCSGALRSDVDAVLKQVGLADSFDVLVSADDVERSKPDPESYTLALRRLSERHASRKMAPASCVAIEDTPAGIASALGAGLKVLAVTNSYSERDLGKATRCVASLDLIEVADLEQLAPE